MRVCIHLFVVSTYKKVLSSDLHVFHGPHIMGSDIKASFDFQWNRISEFDSRVKLKAEVKLAG